MRHTRRPRTIRAATCALLLAGWLAPRALSAPQDEGPPPLPPLGGQPGGDETAELKRLFLEVERNLQRIDELLNDAASGDAPLSEAGESGIEKLLRTTGAESQSVVEGIDKILEVARQRGQNQGQGMGQSSGGQGQQKSDGESPLDQQRDGSPQSQEATPEGMQPGQEDGQQPHDQGQQKPDDGQDPNSPEGSDQEGKNDQGREQTHDQGDPSAAGGGRESWGMLPDKMQDMFRNEGTEDLPVQYRDWIDAYYRRLNRAER